MKLQSAKSDKIKIFIYGITEHETYEFPKDISKNFAFIDDGDVIVSSERIANDERKGHFYFKDADRKDNYQNVMENLQRGLMTLDDFLASRAGTYNLSGQGASISTVTNLKHKDQVPGSQ